MKINITSIVFVATLFLNSSLLSIAQSSTDIQTPIVITASEFHIIPAIRDMVEIPPVVHENREVDNQKHKKKIKFPNMATALPLNRIDPIAQHQFGTKAPAAAIKENFEGMNSSQGSGTPPDPSGAAGPNHYVETVNSSWIIYDRQGGVLKSAQALSTLFPGSANMGDAIVLYDRFADRWMITEFDSNNTILVAISQTPDPLGAWYQYSFPQGSSFPDYPKYSIWSDGYYMTSNKGGTNAMVFERDKMLAGDPNSRQIKMTLPNLAKGGFYSPLSADIDGNTLPPAGTPCYFAYHQDDAWSGVSADEVKVWKFSTDWTNTNNTSVTVAADIPLAPFNSNFSGGFTNITQPGTSQKIDVIMGALMFRLQYRNFNSYQTMVGNFAVNVDGNNQAGIRWFELRDNNDGNGWVLHQEGTYSPDTESRFMGSIAMDAQGNIGMGFTVSGSTVKPSIRYTGRLAGDPLGQMTIAETSIIEGTGVQTGIDRFGDYSQLSLDPTDDLTFWFVNEYFSNSGNWRTRIASFKIAGDFVDDIGVNAIVAPTTASFTSAETVTVKITNFGTNSQSNFPISYTINGSTVTETFTGTLAGISSQSFSFTQKVDMAQPGTYNISAKTALSIDQANFNDGTSISLYNPFAIDLSVISIDGPASDPLLGNAEIINITIKNVGSNAVSNFPVGYSIDGGTPVIETYTNNLASGATASYSFTTTTDLSNAGLYQTKAFISYISDENNLNDTAFVNINHTGCAPTSNCDLHAIKQFKLNTIDNKSSNSSPSLGSCTGNGYQDFTSISTDLVLGKTYNVFVDNALNLVNLFMWIDWNDNFSFEANEIVINNVTQNDTITVPITISANAPLGEHLLRVRDIQGDTVVDACSAEIRGETEDYIVNILEFPLAINEVGNKEDVVKFNFLPTGNLNYEISLIGINGFFNVEIYNSLGQQMYSKSNVNLSGGNRHSVNFESFARGSYMVKISNKNFQKVKKMMY